MARKGKYYTNKQYSYVDPKKMTSLVRNFTDIGIDFSIIAQRNSRAISTEEEEIYEILATNTSLIDEDSPYFDKRFDDKIEFLKAFADNNEIEFIVETICNDTIVPDGFGYCCSLNTDDVKLPEEISDKLQVNFKKIYSLLGWSDGTKAWEDFYKFMTEGFLTFEIIYQYKTRKEIEDEKQAKKDKLNKILNNISESKDEAKKQLFLAESKSIQDEIITLDKVIETGKDKATKPKDRAWYEKNSLKYQEQTEELYPVSVIGFKKIPDNSVYRIQYMNREKNRVENYWRFDKGNNDYVIMSDYEVVQIAYNGIPGNKNKFSYLERLIRNFNLTRKLEESRVGWNILNSQFRMQIVVPLGTKVSSKSKQFLRQVADRYKEEISINERSGEISVNGNAKLNFGRTIVLPSRPGGGEPKIDSINWNGPDLSNMDVVEYFRKNLWRDSYLPQNRFDRSGTIGSLSLFRSEGIPYDEIAYNHFIKRLQSEFGKIIRIPVYIQTVLDFPDLKIDQEFQGKLGLRFNTTSYFEEAKLAEINNAKLNNIQTLLGAMMPDGTTPVYSAEYLYVDKYKLLTPDEWLTNRQKVAAEMQNRGGGADAAAGLGGGFGA